MKISRKKTKRIKVGNVTIGGGSTISIQSMTNTDTADAGKTADQIQRLADAGCDIARISVPDADSSGAIPEIKKRSTIPLIADVHYDWRMAFAAIENGIDAVRINPGNMQEEEIGKIAKKAKAAGISMRIGVNAGSLKRDILKRHGHPTPEALVESALDALEICEKAGFHEVKLSVKASSTTDTIDACRLLSKKTDHPLHIGVSEAGPTLQGTVKSSVGLGILLSEGIGDTMRVSLSADPVKEVEVALDIQKALGLRGGLEIVSCPTCSRCKTDLISLVDDATVEFAKYRDKDIKIAIMGCVVNGPGEAREADAGIAAGAGKGVLFKSGRVVKNVDEGDYLKELKAVVDIIVKKQEAK